MTKLTPIQELADKHCSETFNHAFKGEYSYAFTEPQLEALRQAIISDFVSKCEIAGYLKVTENGSTYFNSSFSGGNDFKQVYALPEGVEK